MNKEAFLQSLERLLKSLKKDERQKFLSYYNEMIEDYIEDGMTEEDAVRHVGKPGNIAEEILSSREAEPPRQVSLGMKILIGVLLILGSPLWGSILLMVLCMLLCVVLMVGVAYVMIWLIPVMTACFSVSGLILCVFSLAGSPLVMFDSAALGVMQIGTGICSAGICLLMGLVTWYLSLIFVKVSRKFTQWLKGLFRRKRGVRA